MVMPKDQTSSLSAHSASSTSAGRQAGRQAQWRVGIEVVGVGREAALPAAAQPAAPPQPPTLLPQVFVDELWRAVLQGAHHARRQAAQAGRSARLVRRRCREGGRRGDRSVTLPGMRQSCRAAGQARMQHKTRLAGQQAQRAQRAQRAQHAPMMRAIPKSPIFIIWPWPTKMLLRGALQGRRQMGRMQRSSGQRPVGRAAASLRRQRSRHWPGPSTTGTAAQAHAGLRSRCKMLRECR